MALNFHIDPSQTIKIIISKGQSLGSSILEQAEINLPIYLDKPYQSRDQLPSYFNKIMTNSIKSEKILSREIIYYANIAHYNSTLELKYYKETLTDIMDAQSPTLVPYFLPNQGRREISGGEIQANWRPNYYWEVNATLAYIDKELESIPSIEHTLSKRFSRWSGSLYAIYGLNNTTSISRAYFGNSQLDHASYDKFTLNINKEITTKLGGLEFTLGVSRLGREEQFLMANNYSQNNHIQLSGGIRYQMAMALSF